MFISLSLIHSSVLNSILKKNSLELDSMVDEIDSFICRLLGHVLTPHLLFLKNVPYAASFHSLWIWLCLACLLMCLKVVFRQQQWLFIVKTLVLWSLVLFSRHTCSKGLAGFCNMWLNTLIKTTLRNKLWFIAFSKRV